MRRLLTKNDVKEIAGVKDGDNGAEVYLHKARLYDSTDVNPPCIVWFWSSKLTGLTYSEFRNKFTGALLKGYPFASGSETNPVQIEIVTDGWVSPDATPIQFDAIDTESIN